MQHASKDLLYLERKNLSSSPESALFVCKKNSVSKEPGPNEKPITNSSSKSQVLGRVKNFLEVISEANNKLQHYAKDNSEKYNIEVLHGDESEVIEMDLMLGIADLHTPEAVAAAESAIIGNQLAAPSTFSSSESDSEESSDDSVHSDNDEEAKSNNQSTDHSNRSPINLKRSKPMKDSRSSKIWRKSESKKRPKILELS